MSRLSISRKIMNEEIELSFSGKLNEDAELMNLFPLDCKKIIFNLKELSMINSCGVREWVNFLHKIPDSVEIVYKNCPYVVVQQASLILGFIREGAYVENMFADFYCSECNSEQQILFEIDRKHFPPKITCLKCGSFMELDALEEEYEGFLKQVKNK